MTEPSLRERILTYIQKQGTWVASADIQKLVVQHTTFSPKDSIRITHQLTGDGELELENRNGVIFYRALKPTVKLRSKVEIINGTAVETFEKVPLNT